MRTSLVSIMSALVISTITGTAMASTQVPSLGSGESVAMAKTYANISQPLDTSFVTHRIERTGLPSVANGHSVAMAETYENISQPLDRSVDASTARTGVNHGADAFGRNGQSAAMADALASLTQPLKAGSGIQVEFEPVNDQVAVN